MVGLVVGRTSEGTRVVGGSTLSGCCSVSSSMSVKGKESKEEAQGGGETRSVKWCVFWKLIWAEKGGRE